MKNKVARKRLQGTEYDYLSMKDHARSKIFVKDWSQIKDIEDYCNCQAKMRHFWQTGMYHL